MKLIKKLNEQRILDTRPDSKFKYLDIDSISGVNDIIEGGYDNYGRWDGDYTARKEMDRLIDLYKEKDLKGMSKDEVREMIGHDLEMIEYDSAQIEEMIPYVLKGLE